MNQPKMEVHSLSGNPSMPDTSTSCGTSLIMRLCDNDSLAWNQLVELYGPLTPACAGLTWNFAAKNQNLIAKYNLGLALSNYGQL